VSTLTIRNAAPGEGAAIAPLYEWLFAEPGSPVEGWNLDVAARRLEQASAADRSTVLVADDKGVLIGFATVYLDIDSVRFGQRAWVEDLAVDPGHRSSGVGKALLDAAKQWSRERGATHLGLESGETRVDAHRFYDRELPSARSRSFVWRL
jgi:GNAT superfamily N-acetyltransferase